MKRTSCPLLRCSYPLIAGLIGVPALIAALFMFRTDGDRRLALEAFDSIRPEMTRRQVREHLTSSGLTPRFGNAMDAWQVRGQFTIWIAFGEPESQEQRSQDEDEDEWWIVESMSLHDDRPRHALERRLGELGLYSRAYIIKGWVRPRAEEATIENDAEATNIIAAERQAK